jgi:hypothetical protein
VAEKQKLLTFWDIVKMLAERYNLPAEIVESILVDWLCIQYKTATDEVKFPDFNLQVDP